MVQSGEPPDKELIGPGKTSQLCFRFTVWTCFIRHTFSRALQRDSTSKANASQNEQKSH